MLWSGCVRAYIWKVDFRFHGARKFVLGFFSGFPQTLKRQRVFGNIHAGLFFIFSNQIFNDFLVKIIAAQMCVAASGFYFHSVISDFQNGYVKSSAAKIINNYLLILFFIQSV